MQTDPAKNFDVAVMSSLSMRSSACIPVLDTPGARAQSRPSWHGPGWKCVCTFAWPGIALSRVQTLEG